MIVLSARWEGPMSTGSSRSSRGAPKAAAPAPSPTLRRWELAARLRELRLAAGRSVDDVAAELMCSAAKISRMETAGRGVQPRDIRDLVRFYGLPDSVREELMHLADEARKPGWWQDYRDLDDRTTTFLGLESAAVESRQFVAFHLPGLLQIPAYTRALITAVLAPNDWSKGQLDQIVELRNRRQQRLLSGDMRLSVVIDQSAFLRAIGSRDVQFAQLEHLMRIGQRSNVSLQVITFGAGPHPGAYGHFQHLRFPPDSLPDVVFIEGMQNNFLLDRAAEVDQYLRVFGLLSSMAMNAADTLTWLDVQHDRLARGDSGDAGGPPADDGV